MGRGRSAFNWWRVCWRLVSGMHNMQQRFREQRFWEQEQQQQQQDSGAGRAGSAHLTQPILLGGAQPAAAA